jgi:hypothetical protein
MSILDGRAILVVEDEPLVAFDICQSLAEAGAQALRRWKRQPLKMCRSQCWTSCWAMAANICAMNSRIEASRS